MEIRFARPDDLPRVREILETVIGNLSIYPEAARERSLSVYTLLKLRQLLAAIPNAVFVAVEDGCIEGVGIAYPDRGTYFIDWICVDPNARKKGVGPYMYSFAKELAKIKNYNKIWGATLAKNRSSVNFLPRTGWKAAAQLNNHWYGVDWILWEYLLDNEPEDNRFARKLSDRVRRFLTPPLDA